MNLDTFIRSGWFSLFIIILIIMGAAVMDSGEPGAGSLLILAGTFFAFLRIRSNIRARKAAEAEEKKKRKKDASSDK